LFGGGTKILLHLGTGYPSYATCRGRHSDSLGHRPWGYINNFCSNLNTCS